MFQLFLLLLNLLLIILNQVVDRILGIVILNKIKLSLGLTLLLLQLLPSELGEDLVKFDFILTLP